MPLNNHDLLQQYSVFPRLDGEIQFFMLQELFVLYSPIRVSSLIDFEDQTFSFVAATGQH